LVEDLLARGRLDRTLIAVMGEFGRSPRINADAGRDHWNYAYSLWLAGGGIRRGYVHGSTDKTGSLPRSDPVTPADVVATIYQCLGISPDLEVLDALGRPHTLVPLGRAIEPIVT
jgi:uncharacterized protein (DUF1501 family)